MRTFERLLRSGGVVLLCGPLAVWCSPAGADTLVAESFDSGAIDESRWVQFGFPPPEVHTEPPALGGGSLDNNGDVSYASGVVTLNTFTLVPDISISFSSHLHAVDWWTPSLNSHNDVWLTDAALEEFSPTHTPESVGPWIRHHGGAIGAGSDSGMTTYFNGQPIVDGENRFEATIREWVDFRMDFLPNGAVNFYRRGQENGGVWPDEPEVSSDPGFVSAYYGTDVRLVAAGKTFDTVHLLDNIVVTPEPSTLALVGLCALGLAGRRR